MEEKPGVNMGRKADSSERKEGGGQETNAE